MRLTQRLWRTHSSGSTQAAAQRLAQWFQETPRHDGKLVRHDIRRRDIVNPELCDQAISLIKSQLPAPGTCDIIDINPGASLWSRALHEAIKPRRHVIIEPEREIYAAAIDPLLNQPESTYRLAPTLGKALDLSEDFLSEHFRQSFGRDVNEAIRYKSNTQLIINANLLRKKIVIEHFQGELMKVFLDQYYRSISFDSGLIEWHRYGLVKLLAWLPHRASQPDFPKGHRMRSRLARELEASCHIREIVSSFPGDGLANTYRPWDATALESQQQARKRQQEFKVEIPPSRRQPDVEPYSIAIDPVPENFDKLRSLDQKPPLVTQYIRAYRKLRKEQPDLFDRMIPGRSGPRPKNDPTCYPEFNNFLKLRGRMRTKHNGYKKVEDLAQEQLQLERTLLAIRQEYPNDWSKYEEQLEEYRPKFEAIKIRYSKMYKDDRYAFNKAVDDYRTLLHGTLAWHRREFEPLLCHPNEDFYPHLPMDLVEITPRESFVQKINTPERQIAFDYLNVSINLDRNNSLEFFLEKLIGPKDSPQFAEFVASIPALTDPLEGGYHDLAEWRTRAMKTDHIIQMAIKYEEWPYRKSARDMLSDIGGWRMASLKG